MNISLENWLRNKLQETEEMHDYAVATDTLRCWIDEYKQLNQPVITSLDNLNIGDTYKYNLDDVGIFKVLAKDEQNWIKVVRTQSGRVTGSFPWTEVYPVNVL